MSSSLTTRSGGAANKQGSALDERTPRNPCAPELTDEMLLARIQNDDKEALGNLFRRYMRRVRGVATRILRDATEAEDLAQDLFLFIRRKAHIFDASKSTASSWVVQMAYHRAIERRRYLTTRQFYSQEKNQSVSEDVAGRRILEDDYSPDAVIKRTGLQEAFGNLSENQRTTLHLFFFEGYTLREISTKLGQPLGNVRGHYYRGLDRLRRHIFQDGTLNVSDSTRRDNRNRCDEE